MIRTDLPYFRLATMVRTTIVISVALILPSALCSPVQGQQTNPVDQSVRPSVFQKMDEFRDKLKQTLGPVAPDPNRRHAVQPNSPGRQAGRSPGRPSNVRQAAYQVQSGNVQSGYSQLNANANFASGYQPDSSGLPTTNSGRAVDSNFHQPSYQQTGYAAPSQPYAGTQQGHYRNGSAIDTGISQQSQITATQRALRLQEENESLRISNQAMIDENKRLREMLNERHLQIEKYNSELGVARTELSSTLQTGSQLKRRVEELLDERAIRERETARMLDSIRSQLDDVLMKEMVEK